jgi:hypothetical protein
VQCVNARCNMDTPTSDTRTARAQSLPTACDDACPTQRPPATSRHHLLGLPVAQEAHAPVARLHVAVQIGRSAAAPFSRGGTV